MAVDKRGQQDSGATSPTPGVLGGFELLAGLIAGRSPDPDALTTDVLKVVIESLEVGLAYVALIDTAHLRVERVLDRAGLGLQEGDQLPIGDVGQSDSFIGTLRPVVLDPATAGARFASPTVKNDFGVAAHAGVTLFDLDGQAYGSLGTVSRQARAVKPGETALMRMAGSVLMQARALFHAAESQAPSTDSLADSPDAIFVIDLDGSFAVCNAAAERLTGLTADSLIGTNFSRAPFWGSGASAIVFEAIAHVMAGREQAPFAFQLTRADGVDLIVEAALAPVHRNGETAAAFVALRDITDRLPALTEPPVEPASAPEPVDDSGPEETLTSERPRPWLEAAPIAVFVLDSDARVLESSGAARTLLGWSEEDLIANQLPAIPADEATEFAETIARVASEPPDGGTTVLESDWQKKDGSRLPVSLSIAATAVPEGSTVVLVVVTDISEQAEALNAMRVSLIRHRQMFEKDDLPKLVFDPATGQIVDANAAASTFYGYGVAELRTLSFADLDTATDGDVEATDPAVTVPGVDPLVNRSHRLASGEQRDVQVHTVPINIEGQTLVYATIYDRSTDSAAAAVLAETHEVHRQELETLAQARILAENERDAAQAALSAARIAEDTSQEDMEAIEEERHSAEQNVLRLAQDLQEARDALAIASAERDATGMNVANLVADRDGALERLASLDAEMARMEERLEGLEQERVEMLATAEQAASERESATASLREIDEYRLTVQEALAEREAERDSALVTLHEIEVERDHLHTTAETATVERDRLQQTLSEIQGERDAAQTQLAEARDQLNAAQHEVLAMRAEQSEGTEAREQIEQERRAANERLGELENERGSALEAVRLLEQQATEAKEALSQLELKEQAAMDVARAIEADRTRASAEVDRLQGTLRVAPLPFIALAADGKVLDWNLAAESILGWSGDQAVGGPLPVLEDADVEEFSALLKRAAAGEPITDIESHWRKQDGTYIDLLVSMTPAPSPDGNPGSGESSGILLAVVDNSEHSRDLAALRDSESRFNSLVDALPDAVFVARLDGTVLRANVVAVKLFGFEEPDDLAGVNVVELVDGSERLRAADWLRQTVVAGSAPSGPFTVLKRDGSTSSADFTGSTSPDEDGEPQALIVMVRDLTERAETEDALARLTELNADLNVQLESVPLPLITLDTTGTVTGWNSAAENMFGWNAEAVTGLHVPFIATASRPDIEKLISLSLEDRSSAGEHAGAVTIAGGTAKGVTESGGSLTLSVVIAPMYDSAGSIKGLMCSVTDVTQQGREEATDRAVLDQLRVLIDASPDAVLLIERDGAIVRANARAAVLYGAESPELMVGTGAFDIVGGTDRPRVLEALGLAAESGEPATFELVVPRSGGATSYLEVRGSPVADRTRRSTSYVLAMRDISRRRQADEERERQRTAAAESENAEREAGFKSLFAGQPQPMWVFDLGTLQILEVNDRAIQQYGYTRNQFLTMRIVDLALEEDSVAVFEAVDRLKVETEIEADWRQRMKDGAVIEVESVLHQVSFARRTAALLVSTDVTERHQTEQALRISLIRHRQMFEKDREIKLLVDPASGKIIDANPAAGSFYGYTTADFRSLLVEDLDFAPSSDRDARENGGIESVDTTGPVRRHHRDAGGQSREVEIQTTSIDVEDRDLLYVIVRAAPSDDLIDAHEDTRAKDQSVAEHQAALLELERERLARVAAEEARDVAAESLTGEQDALLAAQRRLVELEENMADRERQVTNLQEQLLVAQKDPTDRGEEMHETGEAVSLTHAETGQATAAGIIDSAPVPIIRQRRDGTVIAWNPAAEVVFGWSAVDVVNRPIPFVPVESEAAYRSALLANVDSTDAPHPPAEIELRTRHGDAIVVSLSAASMKVGTDEDETLVLVVTPLPVRPPLSTAQSGPRPTDDVVPRDEGAVLLLDLRGRVTSVSAAAERLIGRGLDELAGHPLHEILHAENEHRPGDCPLYGAVRDRAEQLVGDDRFSMSDGQLLAVEYVTRPTRDGGRLTGSEITILSPAPPSATESEVVSENLFQELVARAPVAVCLTDSAGVFTSVNDAFSALVGYSRAELEGQPFTLVLPAQAREAAARRYSNRFEGAGGHAGQIVDEFDLETRSGEIRTVQSTTTEIAGPADMSEAVTSNSHTGPVPDPEGKRTLAWFLTDISDRRRSDNALHDKIDHDELTGLPNQSLFRDRLKKAIAFAHRRGQLAALLHLDLDGFAELNERVGHARADALIQSVAQRLQERARAEDSIARIGGDQFAIFLPDAGSAQNAGLVAEKIRSALETGFDVEGEKISVTASIGISIYPFDGQDPAALLAGAEEAARRAKERGKNTIQFFGIDGT